MARLSPPSKRIILLILISAASNSLILILTVDERTGAVLKDVEPVFLGLFAGIWLATLSFDATSIVMFTRGTDENISILRAMRIATLRIFFNIITPFGFGGQPFAVVSLTREGIPPGKGSSIVVIKLVTLSIVVQLGALISFTLYHRQIETMGFVRIFFLIASFVGAAVTALIIIGFRYPKLLIRGLTWIGQLLHSVRLLKSSENLKRRIIREAALARKSFRLYFLLGTGFNCVAYAGQLLLLYAILRGLGIEVPLSDSLVLGTILLFLIMFMPTPGAIGFAEAFFLILYARVVPTYLLGVALILWRFFYHYLSALFGAVSSSQYVTGLIVDRTK